jgi:hypothetical protein
MNTVLNITVQVICATVIVYIPFRENWPARAREFEARIANLLNLNRSP